MITGADSFSAFPAEAKRYVEIHQALRTVALRTIVYGTMEI